MSLADELLKLQQLRDSGAITEEEYAVAKARVLSGSASSVTNSGSNTSSLSGEEREQQTREFATLIHLSHLCGYPIPIVGFVAPVIIWQMKKDDLPGLDQHGRNAINWIISKFVYGIISAMLVFVLIGIPMLLLLVVWDITCTIIAAIKASNGEAWKYPGAFEVFK